VIVRLQIGAGWLAEGLSDDTTPRIPT
jgi:hypothetical protein